jgi:AcrR family transcriptional regulator
VPPRTGSRHAPSPRKQSSSRSRDLAKQETRAALLEAGLEEFAARGLESPSLDAICARAGFTRGAFYVHFRDREDFVVAVMERVLGAFLDAVIATGDQAHDLERTIHRFARALEGMDGPTRKSRRRSPSSLASGLQVHRLLEACARSTAIRSRVAGLVQQALGRLAQAASAAQSTHTIRRDLPAQEVATMLVMMAIGLLVAGEIGVPLDPRAGRALVLALLGTEPRARNR